MTISSVQVPVFNGGLLAESMKQFAVAGEKAGSVGPHCPALLAQAKLHREPVQLQQAERYIYCIVLLY